MCSGWRVCSSHIKQSVKSLSHLSVTPMYLKAAWDWFFSPLSWLYIDAVLFNTVYFFWGYISVSERRIRLIYLATYLPKGHFKVLACILLRLSSFLILPKAQNIREGWTEKVCVTGDLSLDNLSPRQWEFFIPSTLSVGIGSKIREISWALMTKKDKPKRIKRK